VYEPFSDELLTEANVKNEQMNEKLVEFINVRKRVMSAIMQQEPSHVTIPTEMENDELEMVDSVDVNNEMITRMTELSGLANYYKDKKTLERLKRAHLLMDELEIDCCDELMEYSFVLPDNVPVQSNDTPRTARTAVLHML
jgi:hypothetical protein